MTTCLSEFALCLKVQVHIEDDPERIFKTTEVSNTHFIVTETYMECHAHHLYHCCTSLITVSIINRTSHILIFVELQASQARVASIYEEELELQHPLFDIHGYDEKKVSTFSKFMHVNDGVEPWWCFSLRSFFVCFSILFLEPQWALSQ